MNIFQAAIGIILFFGGAVSMGIGGTIFMTPLENFTAFMTYSK